MCGLLGAIAIMFVEMGLFIVRASKVEHVANRDARIAAAERLSGGLVVSGGEGGVAAAAAVMPPPEEPKSAPAKKND